MKRFYRRTPKKSSFGMNQQQTNNSKSTQDAQCQGNKQNINSSNTQNSLCQCNIQNNQSNNNQNLQSQANPEKDNTNNNQNSQYQGNTENNQLNNNQDLLSQGNSQNDNKNNSQSIQCQCNVQNNHSNNNQDLLSQGNSQNNNTNNIQGSQSQCNAQNNQSGNNQDLQSQGNANSDNIQGTQCQGNAQNIYTNNTQDTQNQGNTQNANSNNTQESQCQGNSQMNNHNNNQECQGNQQNKEQDNQSNNQQGNNSNSESPNNQQNTQSQNNSSQSLCQTNNQNNQSQNSQNQGSQSNSQNTNQNAQCQCPVPIRGLLKENVDFIKKVLGNPKDLIVREISIGGSSNNQNTQNSGGNNNQQNQNSNENIQQTLQNSQSQSDNGQNQSPNQNIQGHSGNQTADQNNQGQSDNGQNQTANQNMEGQNDNSQNQKNNQNMQEQSDNSQNEKSNQSTQSQTGNNQNQNNNNQSQQENHNTQSQQSQNNQTQNESSNGQHNNSIQQAQSVQCSILYISGLTDSNIVNDNILKMLQSNEKQFSGNVLDQVFQEIVAITDTKKVNTFEQVINTLLEGNSILILDGEMTALEMGTAKVEKRSLDEPQSEAVIRGPRIAFIENIDTNISLIRRELKDPNLRFEFHEVGCRSKQRIAVCYVEGIVNPDILNEVNRRIKTINIDFTPGSGLVEQWIEDSFLSPFPQIIDTERPDRVIYGILQGKVSVIVEGSPFALLAPITFGDAIQSIEDYNQRWLIATLMRLLRYLATFIALFAPALYVALVSYHPGMLPTQLTFSIAATREGVPFPSIVEVLLMAITFEILQEAGIRLPKAIGQTVGIVGGIVIGDVAVSAGLVGPMMVITTSLTAIASFTIPNYSMAIGFRTMRFSFIIAASILGLYGIILVFIMMCVHIVNLKSMGIPYSGPFAPYFLKDLKNVIIRAPITTLTKRPPYLEPEDMQKVNSGGQNQ